MNFSTENKLQAAALGIEINPHAGVVPIYGVNFAVPADKDTQLEANLLLLESNNVRVLLISIDTFFASASFKKSLIRKLGDNCPVKEENILLIASHAHNAPSLDDTKPFLCRAIPEYMELVMIRLAEAILKLPERLQAADFHFGTDTNDLTINRRKWSWGRHGIIPVKKLKLLPNEKGLRDNTLRAWKVISKDSKQVLAILWNYACHPVGFYNKSILSGDFPNYVRQRIKSSVAEVPVLFLPGFMGELRPNLTGFPQNFRDFLVYITGDKVFIRPNERLWKKWADSLAASAVRALELASPLPENTPLALARTELSMKILVQKPHPGMLELFVMQGIGKQVFALASAEVLVGYKGLLTAAFGVKEEDFIPVGYVNQVFGYLPVDKQIKEDGYEVSGFMPWFSMGGNEFFPHIEHYVIDPWKKLYESINQSSNTSEDNNSKGKFPFLLDE